MTRPTGIPLDTTADDGLVLAGTLTLPPGPGPHPAALLLWGSGPIDRDSDAGRIRLALGPALAAALASRGVASYRFDRRGVGATPGDWRASTFTQNRQDAAAVLRALRSHPGVRPDAVAVIGHSEGALHAAALGAHGDVAAVVLLAAAAQRGEDVLLWQARMIGEDLPHPVRLLLRLLRTDVGRQQAKNLAKIRASTGEVARIGGARVNVGWMREFLDHDPRPDLAAIGVPVLALTGDKDVQVDPDDLDAIADLVQGETQTVRVPDLTHLLRRDPGRASVRHYRRLLREPVDAAVVDEVADWTAGRLSAAERG